MLGACRAPSPLNGETADKEENLNSAESKIGLKICKMRVKSEKNKFKLKNEKGKNNNK